MSRRPNNSFSIRVARTSKRERERCRLALVNDLPRQLPETRGDCLTGPRPCPHVSCKHHLYLDVSPTTGTILLNFPELEPHEMRHSCSLDVAETEEFRTHEEIAALVGGKTKERIRQIEAAALAKLADFDDANGGGLRDCAESIALPEHALARASNG